MGQATNLALRERILELRQQGATNPELLRDVKVIKELIDQIYQFSRMYWKSVSQQNLPVTIKYPEMLTEIFAHFEDENLPPYGRRNLWFL